MFVRSKSWLRRQAAMHKACIVETWKEGLAGFRALDKRGFARALIQRRWWGWYFLLAVIIALSITLSIYHDQMVDLFRPWQTKIYHSNWAWVVPVIALIVVSVPPLMGHEIIILVVGVVWHLGWGFVIAIAGTFLGEVMCYYLFKYTFRERAIKIEQSSKMYYYLAEIMRRDGWPMVALVRFSAVPGHVTTAMQSTIGISIWVYCIAAAISLPKQLALVYLGVLFGDAVHKPPADATPAQISVHLKAKHRKELVTWSVLIVTTLATVVALYAIWFRIWQVRKEDEVELREAASENSVGDGKATTKAGKDALEMPSLEYWTTASSGNRTPAPSYRELYGEQEKGRGSPAQQHVYGRSGYARSRSSTIASLAFTNNSLPYLPYTPMLEVPAHLHGLALAERMPTPVPSAVVSNGSVDEDADLEKGEDRSSPRQTEAGNALRARRGRLNRSNSNLTLASILTPTSPKEQPDSPLEAKTSPRSGSPLLDGFGRARSRSRSGTLMISNLPLYSASTDGIPGLRSPLRYTIQAHHSENMAEEEEPKEYITAQDLSGERDGPSGSS